MRLMRRLFESIGRFTAFASGATISACVAFRRPRDVGRQLYSILIGSLPLGFVTADYFDGNNRPRNAADRDQLTGWSINGGQGKPHEIVFNLADPIRKPGKLELSMLFEKYYAAGLGKFRISGTTDDRKAEARGIPDQLLPLVSKDPHSLTEYPRKIQPSAPLLNTKSLAPPMANCAEPENTNGPSSKYHG